MTIEARNFYLWGLVQGKVSQPCQLETLERFSSATLGCAMGRYLRVIDEDTLETSSSWASTSKECGLGPSTKYHKEEINQANLRSVRSRFGTQRTYKWKPSE